MIKHPRYSYLQRLLQVYAVYICQVYKRLYSDLKCQHAKDSSSTPRGAVHQQCFSCRSKFQIAGIIFETHPTQAGDITGLSLLGWGVRLPKTCYSAIAFITLIQTE